MSKSELRNQKRKEPVEAIILRKQPASLAARVFKIPLRTAFNWFVLYRSGGWQALNKKSKQGECLYNECLLCCYRFTSIAKTL